MKTSSHPPSHIDRRTFLRTAAVCGTAFAFSSSVANAASGELSKNKINVTESESSPIPDYQFLTEDDIPFVRSILLAVAEPALSESTDGMKSAMIHALHKFDEQCSQLSPMMQTLLRKLLLASTLPVAQGLTTGIWKDWWLVSRSDAEQFMDRWQHSRLSLQRMGHASLVQLTAMIWYGTEEGVADIGFPGIPHPKLLVTEPNSY